jgi:hypothetical protein
MLLTKNWPSYWQNTRYYSSATSNLETDGGIINGQNGEQGQYKELLHFSQKLCLVISNSVLLEQRVA